MSLKKTIILMFLLGLGLSLGMCWLSLAEPFYFKMLHYKLFDALLQENHKAVPSDRVAIVDIDERTLAQYGQWPWPRYRLARLLKKIKYAGAEVIAVDILFAEQDRTSPQLLEKRLQKDLGVRVQFSDIPLKYRDNDALLAAVLEHGSYVLGYVYGTGGKNRTFQKEEIPNIPLIVKSSPQAQQVSEYMEQKCQAIYPIPKIIASGNPLAFINAFPDLDGVIRRCPLLIACDQSIAPHMSLRAVIEYWDKKDGPAVPVLHVDQGGVKRLRLQERSIPLDGKGRMLIDYYGPEGTLPYISALDLLEGNIQKGGLADKIIFLGSTAAGLNDIHAAPLDPAFPGLETMATMADNIISGDVLYRPSWALGVELGMTLMLGILMALLVGYSGAKLALPLTVAVGASVWYGSLYMIDAMHMYISPFYPLATILLTFSLLTLARFFMVEKEKRFIRKAFSKYVSPDVVAQITKNPQVLELDGEEKELSIMFSDIRGFTSISENIPANMVSRLLKDYFTPVTNIILKNKGTLDKFIGDAVMAFWNAPLEIDNYKKRSVAAAMEMLHKLDELNVFFVQEYGFPVNIGIGLHNGICQVGNMGSEDFFDYTIIGDNVNLASRLEGLCKYYMVNIIVSEDFISDYNGQYVYQELDTVKVKGKENPVKIYTLHDPGYDENVHYEIEMHEKALRHYKNKEFYHAKVIFLELRQKYAKRHIYELYVSRCEHYLQHPPQASDEYLIHNFD